MSPDGARLAAVHVLGMKVNLVDLAGGQITASVSVPAETYTALFSNDGTTLFVSLWGGARVMMLDAKTLAPKGEVAVGEHPNAMVQAADGRVFVACANTNAAWVVDPAMMKATEQISVALFPNAPPGSPPNALSLSPDGRRLLIANADNNTVSVVDVSVPGKSRVTGFIPTGWYPTGVAFSQRAEAIFILSGKGLTSLANPRGAQPGIPYSDGQYTGSMLTGSLSILATPDDEALRKYTNTVYRVTPYSDATRLAPAAAPVNSAVPPRVGAPSPITHVFYVIRENRTYDQILGDLTPGNGDPNLALFGQEITPNAHALARQFVTLDNFYVDAEVSYDGHAFSTGAYATDLVEKFWPTNYASRGAAYLSEGGGAMRNAYGNVAAPMNGYLWDACARAGKTYRSYGEFADKVAATGLAKATVPGLEGHLAPEYAAWDLNIPDNRRIDAWQAEFRKFEAAGTLPALSILRLGGDHTQGTSAGKLTPRAMIAENDVALGRLVEIVSHGDLRPRGRRAEWAGPRGRASVAGVRDQPLLLPRRRQHALHDLGDAPDDGAHPGLTADEPVRRVRAADVPRADEPGGAGAVQPPRGAGLAHRDECRTERGRRGLCRDELRAGRHGAGTRAERDPLAVDPRARGRHAAAAACRVHQARRRRPGRG